MLTDAQREFLANHHNGALTTFRRNGAAQMSIVTCGLHGDGVAFTTTADRAKLRNLGRNPRCTILVGTDDWRNFVVLEGEARLVGVDTVARTNTGKPCATCIAPPPAGNIPIGRSTTRR